MKDIKLMVDRVCKTVPDFREGCKGIKIIEGTNEYSGCAGLGDCPVCEGTEVCFRCGHGASHHQHADACRYENCQCPCYD
jgi:hypothetical protein